MGQTYRVSLHGGRGVGVGACAQVPERGSPSSTGVKVASLSAAIAWKKKQCIGRANKIRTTCYVLAVTLQHE